MTDLSKTIKDAAYITVGFGVIAFQKAQVRRRELEKQLGVQSEQWVTKAEEFRSQLVKVADEVESRSKPVVEAVETRLDQLEEKLPEQARDAFKTARAAAKDAQDQLRTRLLEAPVAKTKTNGKAKTAAA